MIHHRTKLIALIALLLFLGSGALYGLLQWWLFEHHASLEEARQQNALRVVEARAASELEALVASTLAEREQLVSYILADAEIIDFLAQVESTAREQGVAITTKSLTTEAIDDQFESLKVTLALEGSFTQVLRMVALLETMPLQVTIMRTELRNGEEESTWSATVDMLVTKFKKT